MTGFSRGDKKQNEKKHFKRKKRVKNRCSLTQDTIYNQGNNFGQVYKIKSSEQQIARHKKQRERVNFENTKYR